jgi:tripartite-type tricarboxylate transporter receptor subunit TctC
MAHNDKSRRDVLKIAAAGGLVLAAPSIVRAAEGKYPSRPIKIIIPFAPGGGSDRLTRVFMPYLQKELGQPLQVEYMPGGGTVLGNAYLLAQKPDGYTISNTAVNYTAVTLAQGLAQFKGEDFWMINLPSRDFTLGATAADSKLTSFNEVIEKLRKDPTSLSVGMQASSVDYVNMILALRSAGIDTTKLRVVTYDGGGVVRNSVMGGQVDVGFVGAEGYLPLMEKIKPLVGFWDKALFPAFNDTPTIGKIGSDMGFATDFLEGSQRGWQISTALKDKNPDVYKVLLGAFERATKDPEAVKASEAQQLPLVWYGPEESNAAYLKTVNTLVKYKDLLKGA